LPGAPAISRFNDAKEREGVKMKAVKAALFGGLIAGTIDIVYAFVVYGLMFGAKPIGIRPRAAFRQRRLAVCCIS
jgi:hypothetical protein